MLNGIITQAHNVLDGNIAQTLLIPAATLRYSRLVSPAHPRTQWRKQPYSGAIFTDGFDPGLRYDWTDRHYQDTQITADPVGFELTDDEYLEIAAGGDLPRNVSLRAMRALDAIGAALLGAGANKPVETPVLLRLAEDETAFERLQSALGMYTSAVEHLQWAWLRNQTPDAARARKAGPQRNHANLPQLPGATQAAPMFEVIGETEVAFVKPVTVVEVARPVLAGDTLFRPNGEKYIAREIKGGVGDLSDIELYRTAAAEGWNTLAFGPPGTGKTAAFEVAFPGLITMLGTAETEPADFLGQYVQTAPGRYTWVDGPLVVAMEQGKALLVDEIGLIDPRACAVLYSVMDGRLEINVTANPARGIVRAKPGFSVCAATNPHAPGVRLSEALLSRCGLQLEVTSDYDVMRKLGVNDRIVDAAEHLAKLVETGESSWAPQARELLAFRDMEAKLGLVLAIRNLLNQAPELEREMVTAKLRERFGDLPNVRRIKPLGVG